ncbi:MAG: GNAT family N-acetyltransferase [Thermodesulfobacteriota bacterium]
MAAPPTDSKGEAAEAPLLYSGTHIVLRRLAPEDAPLLFDWLSAADGARYRDGLLAVCPRPDLLASRIAMQLAISPPLEYEALILHAPSHTPIGIVGLSSLDFLNGKAEFSLLLTRGRGTRCVLEAVAAVLERAFGELGLYKLIFLVRPDNRPVLRLLARFEVPEEGRLREELAVSDGTRLDLCRFSLLRREWRAHPLRSRLLALFPQAKV